jgi:peptide/nickel transport system substrate-binding protein
MSRYRRVPGALTFVVLVLLAGAAIFPAIPAGAAGPEGQMTWAVHTTIVPTWFDPADAMHGTPFMVLSALHDALVKPMPGRNMAPNLAESWTTSPDGLVYEFVLRKGARFHNGEPVTAEDVKFSFERYRGIFAKTFKDKVAAVETPDPGRVRFRLKQPWPDFMTFYGTRTTAAGWIVPKQYVEKVGDEGFKKAPIGAGPYRFVSFKPGVELVVEAFDGYWRKTPHVKRIVLRTVPDDTTRLAALKRVEVDVAYLIGGELAVELQRTPGLTLKPVFPSMHWLAFVDQWDPKSPWHDKRVRLAANLAMDRPAVNQAITLGLSKLTGSIVPSSFDFYWQPPLYPYDPNWAKQLLAEAGYPNGFDAGEYHVDLQLTTWGESIITNLKAVKIHLKLRPYERAAFFKGMSEKKFKNIVHVFSGASGNTATWLENFVVAGGAYVPGSYPDIDGLFREQAAELDRVKREAILHRVQQLMHERTMFAPIWELAFLHGFGPRVEESALGLMGSYGFSAPYEDAKLKGK